MYFMNSRYIILLSFFVSFLSIGQTELIAYKSHSGDMANFKTEGFDNLGIPPLRIDTIIILNDSTIIEISSRHWNGRAGFCLKDTVVNHPKYKNHTDYKKLRGTYYDTSIVFINYDTLSVKQKKKLQRKKKKNYIVPMVKTPPNSNKGLGLVLGMFVILVFTIIWQINKRNIIA